MGFRLGHNGKGSNGFLEASSSSAIKLYEHLRKHRPTRPKTSTVLSHSYPPNRENHTKQTAPQPCFPPQQTPLLPLKKSASPSSPLSTLPPHQPPPPSTTHTCPPSPNPKTQPNQTFSHPLPHATAITPRDSHHENPFTPAPAPPTPASIPNPAHSILKDNSSANHSFASPRRRFHGILNFPGLSGVVVDDVQRGGGGGR